MTWQEEIARIVNDNQSGAVAVTAAAANALITLANEGTFSSSAELIELIGQTSTQVLQAQSGIASLVGLYNRILFAVSVERDADAGAMILRETVKGFLSDQQRASAELTRRAVALLPHGVSIVTHSGSGTVLNALKVAAQNGRDPWVICHESRPGYEGRNLAASLAEAKIPVTLTTDAAMFSNVKNCELVLVGADALSEDGIVGKLGTAALAICSKWLGVPCYVLADTSKVWPTSLSPQPVKERPPTEVWDAPPDDVKVANRYYDVAPWDSVSGVVTELGMLSAKEIRDLARERTVHNTIGRIIAAMRELPRQ